MLFFGVFCMCRKTELTTKKFFIQKITCLGHTDVNGYKVIIFEILFGDHTHQPKPIITHLMFIILSKWLGAAKLLCISILCESVFYITVVFSDVFFSSSKVKLSFILCTMKNSTLKTFSNDLAHLSLFYCYLLIAGKMIFKLSIVLCLCSKTIFFYFFVFLFFFFKFLVYSWSD